MLGAPAEPKVEAAGRNRRPGVAAGLCRTAVGGGEVLDVEASRLPGSGALVLIGRQGEVIAAVGAHRAVVAARQRRKLRPRPGLPARHRRHLHVQLDEVPQEGVSAGVTMAAALVSALTRRRVSTDDVAMTGEVTLGGQVLPTGGIAERVLAAHRGGLRRVLLSRCNRKRSMRISATTCGAWSPSLPDAGRRCWSWPCSPRRLRAAWRHSRRPAARPEPAERQPARCDEDE